MPGATQVQAPEICINPSTHHIHRIVAHHLRAPAGVEGAEGQVNLRPIGALRSHKVALVHHAIEAIVRLRRELCREPSGGCMVTGGGFMVTGGGFMVTGGGFMVTRAVNSWSRVVDSWSRGQ
eukprot:1175601-Prorocentrum_minimum.AAC.4